MVISCTENFILFSIYAFAYADNTQTASNPRPSHFRTSLLSLRYTTNFPLTPAYYGVRNWVDSKEIPAVISRNQLAKRIKNNKIYHLYYALLIPLFYSFEKYFAKTSQYIVNIAHKLSKVISLLLNDCWTVSSFLDIIV